MPSDEALKAVREFVKRRSSSTVGIGHISSASVRSSAAQVPARLKRVEFGGEDDTLSGTDFHRALPDDVEAWSSTLLGLFETLDEEVQVFWFGRRISKAGVMDWVLMMTDV